MMTWAAIWETIIKYWVQFALGGIVTVGGILYRRISKKLSKQRSDEQAVKAGVEALLADRLIQLHNHYHDRGHCPTYAKRSAESMYNAYHGLGGNGSITDIYDRIKGMPVLEERG